MPFSSGASVDAVTIDAFGTLVELENPVGRLQAALAERGVERGEKAVAAAFAAEVDYYLVHKGEGRDDATLLDLRNRCAGVFAIILRMISNSCRFSGFSSGGIGSSSMMCL